VRREWLALFNHYNAESSPERASLRATVLALAFDGRSADQVANFEFNKMGAELGES
jgi:hypothetical protein